MYVFDSRNNSTKLEVPIGINYIDYKEKVIINKSCTRYANVNEESNLSFSGEWFNSSFGAYNNQLSATYKYRQKGGNEWIQGTTNINITVDGNTYSYSGYIKGDTNNGFATENSYEIEIIVTDSLSSKSDTTILIAGEPAMDIYHSNVSIGGYYNEDESEAQYQSQFHKKTNFYNGVYKNGVEIATLNDIPSTLDIYSTDEIVVGTWIDGKPIYRKVVNVGSGSGIFTHPHGISNLDIVVNTYGSFLQGGTHREPLPKTTFANASPGWSAHIDDFTDTTFSLHFGTGIGTATKICVVIEYTKTTD